MRAEELTGKARVWAVHYAWPDAHDREAYEMVEIVADAPSQGADDAQNIAVMRSGDRLPWYVPCESIVDLLE